MLKFDNNRKTLYQWDVGVVGTLTIDGVDEVHFSNLRYGVSFNIKVIDNKVKFPPEVLQSGADVFCWAFVREQNGGYTKKEQTFNVEKRPRPADYVYEPTEILSWETLKKEIEKLDENTTEALADLEKGTIKKSDILTELDLETIHEEHKVYSANIINGIEKGIHEIVEVIGEEYATKTELENLKTEILGDLDEISDIVGGEEPEPDETEVAE